MIKQSTIDRVIETVRIEEVIEDFVRLKKRGANMLGLCPFHQEKTPSFNVNISGNYFKCFGCGQGGNAVQFIMEHEKLSFPEAIKYLANKYNIQVEEEQVKEEDKQEHQHRENLLALTQYAANFYQKQLFDTPEGQTIGLSYFKERGFREHIIKEFMLGYASKDKMEFSRQAIKDGYTKEMLVECGLATSSGNDFFYQRVMFTIQDMSGRPIAFAGRIMGSNIKGPKYINSPETEIYKKSYVLYGFYQARRAMRKEDLCIVVEGYTDVLSMYQAGVENVVASSGTALTEGQIRLIKRFTDNILMLYDADNAGIGAATKAIDLILEQDMHPLLVLLPEGEDPDSFVNKSGADGFMKYMDEHVMDFITFRLHLIDEKDKNDPIIKTNIIKEVISSIAKIPDPIKRSLYVRECAVAFGIEEGTIAAELTKLVRKNVYRERQQSQRADRDRDQEEKDPKKAPSQKTTITNPDSFQEKDILRILILWGDEYIDEDEKSTLADFILTNLADTMDAFGEDLHKRMFHLAKEALDQKTPVNKELYLKNQDPVIQQAALELIATPWEYSSNWVDRWGIALQTQVAPDDNYLKDATQAILRFKLKKIIHQAKEIQQEIETHSKENRFEEVEKLIKVYQKLAKDRNDVAKLLNVVVL